MYGLNLIQGPAVEPASLSQAKNFCAIDDSFHVDDQLILGFIAAARKEAERYCRRAFFEQKWRLSLDRFPVYWGRTSTKSTTDTFYPYNYYFEGLTILLPKPHCVSVDKITYLDVLGHSVEMDPSAYILDSDSEPARVISASGSYWPTVTIYVPGAVKIEFTAKTYGSGQGDIPCPQNVVTAICLLAAHFYSNREGGVEIPSAFYRLLDSEKFETFSYGAY